MSRMGRNIDVETTIAVRKLLDYGVEHSGLQSPNVLRDLEGCTSLTCLVCSGVLVVEPSDIWRRKSY